MLNSKFRKKCQPLISKLQFWIFPLFLSHTLHYFCKQQGIYALKIVRQCLAFVVEYFGLYSLSKQKFKTQFKNSTSDSDIRAHLMS